MREETMRDLPSVADVMDTGEWVAEGKIHERAKLEDWDLTTDEIKSQLDQLVTHGKLRLAEIKCVNPSIKLFRFCKDR